MSYRSKSHLLGRLMKKAYRDAYTEEHVKTAVPQQIRAIRVKRDLTQNDLAKLAKTTQTVIARVEDINYGNLSLNTLIKIAGALDVGLLVKFVPYSRLIQEFEDRSNEAMNAEEFAKDIRALQHWASSEQKAMVISEGLRQKISGLDLPSNQVARYQATSAWSKKASGSPDTPSLFALAAAR